MAENCPPAMVAAAAAPDSMSPRGSLATVLVGPPPSSPLPHSSLSDRPAENGFIRHRRSQPEDEAPEGAGDGAPLLANGHMASDAVSIRMDLPNGGEANGAHHLAYWEGDRSARGSPPRPMMSPFETEHAQSRPLEGEGLGLQGLVLAASSSHDGQIHRWWAQFDARIMQPFFGGPQNVAEASQIVQAEGNVVPVVAAHVTPRGPLSQTSMNGSQRPDSA